MATTVATLAAERWLDEVILYGDLPANVLGAAVSEEVSLPAGIGDVAIMNVELQGLSIDVLLGGGVPRPGVQAFILSADGATVVDTVGVAPWANVGNVANSLKVGAFVQPDALVLWRQGELLSITTMELDTDATPTGDLRVYIKAVRVRPLPQSGVTGGGTFQEFRLVR